MTTESPREQVSEIAHAAAGAAQQAMGRQKDSVADSLGNFAGALRNAARDSSPDGNGAGPIAEWAANGLERASTAMRSQDLQSMLHTAEVFARRQPVAFFLAAAAAGFLATRFIKAGTETADQHADDRDMSPDDASTTPPSAYPSINPM